MKGSLLNIKVIDIIRSLTTRTVASGHLRLFEDAAPTSPGGDIYIAEGGVVGARLEPFLEGHYALYRLLEFKGFYEYAPEKVPDDKRNMQLLSSARLIEFENSRKQRWGPIQAAIPDSDCAPVPNPRFSASVSKMNWASWKWRALPYMDGMRSVKEIASLAQIDELSISQLIVQLQEDGIMLPQVRLSDRYMANRIRVVPPQRRTKRAAGSDNARRVGDALVEDSSLATVADRAGLSYGDTARAVVELLRMDAVVVPSGEKDLDDLARSN